MEPVAGSPPASQDLLTRIGYVGVLVDKLVDELVALREHLEAEQIVMPHWYSYRLATILSRVDHAGAEIVISQGRRAEAEGQVEAFGDDGQ